MEKKLQVERVKQTHTDRLVEIRLKQEKPFDIWKIGRRREGDKGSQPRLIPVFARKKGVGPCVRESGGKMVGGKSPGEGLQTQTRSCGAKKGGLDPSHANRYKSLKKKRKKYLVYLRRTGGERRRRRCENRKRTGGRRHTHSNDECAS